MRRLAPAVLTAVALAALAAPASGDPAPADPAYTQRDLQNIADAYGRIHGPGGQLRNPAYLPALVAASTQRSVDQLLTQVASPTHPALTPGNAVPGWNVGNPLRAGWHRTRGLSRAVTFENRYGAQLRGHVYKPLPGAVDPYTGRPLRGPFPGVVVTEGSVQGSEGMYEWLAQDLAERGYVVLTYDVQGQGTSETLPHQPSPLDPVTGGGALPFCNPFAAPEDGEMLGCPGVPSQQLSNFVVGTEDALDFFTSRANPYRRSLDLSPDPRPATPGRTTRIAIIGHSMGAAAVSKVQGTDRRVAAVVALDKLTGPSSTGPLDGAGNRPVVPALAVQAEYGFTVSPWFLSGGSSLAPSPSPDGPDPMRERASGYDAWRAAGVDAMLVVPRASTHLEFT
ncbi:MAG TPA: alpha/beta hydrolase, partial [Nocardioides sp.]|nr:alpha/beta hydrolase [Nocardioides sp.]